MWATIELRELRVFLALAEELHFRRTAERLGLTQSRVSQSLRELEHKLGGQLVSRTSRRVALTPLGERFRTNTAAPYEQLIGVLERTSTMTRRVSGAVKLGLLFPTSGGTHLTEMVQAFEQRYPGCEVDVIDLPLSDPLGPLRRGEVDLIAMRLPLREPDLVIGPVMSREPRVLAVSRQHPLAQREQVSLEDVTDYEVVSTPFLPKETVQEMLPATSHSGRVIPRSRHVAHTLIDIITLVSLGRVVHPTVPSVPAYFNHANIVCIPIGDLPASSTALIWRRRGTDATSRAFIELARETLASRREQSRAKPRRS
jgi:DNA-binding transcriptional LysR family regulator